MDGGMCDWAKDEGVMRPEWVLHNVPVVPAPEPPLGQHGQLEEDHVP